MQASREVQHAAGWLIIYLMHMVMTPDEPQIQMFADYWPHACNNMNNMHVVFAMKRLRTDKNCPAENPSPNHIKNKQHFSWDWFSRIAGPLRSVRDSTLVLSLAHGEIKYRQTQQEKHD